LAAEFLEKRVPKYFDLGVEFLLLPRFFDQGDFFGLELARSSFRFFETPLLFIEKILLLGTILWPRKNMNGLFERITLIDLQHCEHRFALRRFDGARGKRGRVQTFRGQTYPARG
jgi:hypothetical protein